MGVNRGERMRPSPSPGFPKRLSLATSIGRRKFRDSVDVSGADGLAHWPDARAKAAGSRID